MNVKEISIGDTVYTIKDPNALTNNDKHTITGWGFPSSKYIDLTVGASGAIYTAPANGYIYMNVNHNVQGISFVTIGQGPWSSQRVYYSPGQLVSLPSCVPVSKGDFIVAYSGVSFNNLRFIYAEGEK